MNPLANWYQGTREDWPMVPLRSVATLGTGHTPDRTKPEYWENCTIPWVTAADLSTRPSEFEPLAATSQHVSRLGVANSSAVVHPTETVMFCRTASVGLLAITNKPMATTQAFVTWTAGPDLLPRYLLYVIAAMRPELMRIAYGSTHLTIYMPDLKALEIPLPPLGEQRRIANLLDDQIARLDRLFLRRRDTSLLQERTTALLRTEIPVGRGGAVLLKHKAKLGTGHTPSRDKPEYWIDCTIPWVSTADIPEQDGNTFEALTSTKLHISELGLQNSAAVVHPANTVMLCRTASVGLVTITAVPMATSQRFATWTAGPDLMPRYLLFSLAAMRPELLALANGSTHGTIYMPDIESIRIPDVDLFEQRRAVARLDAQLPEHAALRAAMRRSVELIQERKQALITAAVTGQLDVTTARSVA